MVGGRGAELEMTGKPDSGARHRLLDLRVDRPAECYAPQHDGALRWLGPFGGLRQRDIAKTVPTWDL
jgi:hypothetical protein